MATGVGYQTIAAVGEETTVNTRVNATQRIRNLEFTPEADYTHLLDESLSGTVGQVTPDLGVLDIRGTWRCLNTYTLSHLLLKHFFGTLATGRYSFLDSLEGKALTWAIDKQVSVWELGGVKINELVLNFSPETVELSGSLIGQSFLLSGTENTAAELAALIPQIDRRCKLAPDLNVRIGVATAPLGVPEEISVSDGSITLTRAMAEQHVNGTRNILEPVPDNFLTGTISLTLSRYTTNQYQTWKAANTRLSLRIFFDDESSTKSQEWIIPNIVLTATPSPVNGPGFIPLTLEGMITIGQDSYTASTISADTADDSFNDSANLFPMAYPGGQLIVVGPAGVNSGTHTITSRTAGKIIVGTNLTNQTAASHTLIIRNPFAQINEL